MYLASIDEVEDHEKETVLESQGYREEDKNCSPESRFLPNFLQIEDPRSSVEFFERPLISIMFDTSFNRKVGRVYAPIFPTLQFEENGDRATFIDSQR